MATRRSPARPRRPNPLSPEPVGLLDPRAPLTGAQQGAIGLLRLLVQREGQEQRWTYRGYSCFLRRATPGHWGGYVALPPGHPLFEKDAEDLVNLSVHGGLTMVQHHQGQWILGFDAGHMEDLSPRRVELSLLTPDLQNYWSAQRMKAETERMVDQIEDEGTALLAAEEEDEAYTDDNLEEDWAELSGGSDDYSDSDEGD